MNEKNNTKEPVELIEAIMAPEEKKFKGYTMSELRRQRQLADVRRQFLKEKLINDVYNLKSASLFSGKKEGKNNWSILGKVFQVLSYADYLAVGLTVFNSSRKLIGLFRKK